MLKGYLFSFSCNSFVKGKKQDEACTLEASGLREERDHVAHHFFLSFPFFFIFFFLGGFLNGVKKASNPWFLFYHSGRYIICN